MTTLSDEFKKQVADLYIQNREQLEKLDAEAMEDFATQVLQLVVKEKKQSEALHDLELLEYNMALLKNYSASLKNYKPDTDKYDFTKNDAKNLVDATKKWLTLEKLI